METIGKYKIQRVLGRGGMGTVYEAIDPHLHRKVAVKTMIQGLSQSPDLKARFLREAQAAGSLRHRNIVTVYDLGEDQGQPYIAMEFIEGTDLEKIIQNREPHPLEWKLDVLRQVCAGLGYAHRSGIVHRDVKPANIRVTPEGEVKIMDFGIAHLQSSTMTKSGLVLGTVHYMAPEQIDGQKVDHRADIFAVGAIAYELISNRKPFEGDSLTAVMFKITHESPDPTPFAHTPYSPGLEQTIMKALARDVSARYRSLDEMHADLDRLLREGHARSAASPTPPAEDAAARVARIVEEAQGLLGAGNAAAAFEGAKEALRLAPQDKSAQEVLRIAEGEVLRKRVEGEIAEIRAAMDRARAEGHLQKALGFCRRLLELNPSDPELTKIASQIEAAIRDREVEDLCGLALAYAAEGDTELAQKIAARIERLSPRNRRYLQLRKYLDEETARRKAEALTSAARELLAFGNLAEAHAAVEEALQIYPGHAVAREIRDRTGTVLAAQEKRAARFATTDAPPTQTASPPAALDEQRRAEAPPPSSPAEATAPGPPAPALAAPEEVPLPAPTPVAAPLPPEPTPAPTPPGPTSAPPRPEPEPAPAPPGPAPAPLPPAREAAPLPPAREAAPAQPEPTPAPTPPGPTSAPPPREPEPAPAPPGPAPAPLPPARELAPAPPEPQPAPAPPEPAPAPAQPPPLTPLPEGGPGNPDAARLLESARRQLRERLPQRALKLLEEAAALEGDHPGIQRLLAQTRVEARRAEVESLTTAALDAFVQNKHKKARTAVEKALALDPKNRKAQELLKILGSLG